MDEYYIATENADYEPEDADRAALWIADLLKKPDLFRIEVVRTVRGAVSFCDASVQDDPVLAVTAEFSRRMPEQHPLLTASLFDDEDDDEQYLGESTLAKLQNADGTPAYHFPPPRTPNTPSQSAGAGDEYPDE